MVKLKFEEIIKEEKYNPDEKILSLVELIEFARKKGLLTDIERKNNIILTFMSEFTITIVDLIYILNNIGEIDTRYLNFKRFRTYYTFEDKNLIRYNKIYKAINYNDTNNKLKGINVIKKVSDTKNTMCSYDYSVEFIDEKILKWIKEIDKKKIVNDDFIIDIFIDDYHTTVIDLPHIINYINIYDDCNVNKIMEKILTKFKNFTQTNCNYHLLQDILKLLLNLKNDLLITDKSKLILKGILSFLTTNNRKFTMSTFSKTYFREKEYNEFIEFLQSIKNDLDNDPSIDLLIKKCNKIIMEYVL